METKRHVLQLAAGQGKTFICLLLASTLISLGRKVRIVVPNSLLKRQYKQDLDIYITNDPKCQVVSIEDLEYVPKDNDWCYICDEADYMLEHQAIHLAVG